MAESDRQVQLFDEGGEIFEQHAQANGKKYWFARDFMAILGSGSV